MTVLPASAEQRASPAMPFSPRDLLHERPRTIAPRVCTLTHPWSRKPHLFSCDRGA